MIMEPDGFRVKLDLSHFLNDFKKFSCIYVDLSRDRQIVDVIDRISVLFEIKGPLCLLDENFYLPESENVNVLRGSTVIKVTKPLHAWNRNDDTTEILRNSYSCKQNHNHAEISENIECTDFQQDIEVNNSSAVNLCSAKNQDKNSKKRKKRELESSDFDCAKDESLQENFKSDVHYQKKCKRKKEKIRKDVYSNTLKQEGEIERIDTDNPNLKIKHKRKKYRNEVQERELNDAEDRIYSKIKKDSFSVNESEQIETATEYMKNTCKHKQELKQCESLDMPKEDSTLLAPSDKVECNSIVTDSKDSRKHKKEQIQNELDVEMTQEHSFLSNTEKYNTSWLASNSGAIQKKSNEAKIDDKNNNDSNHPINYNSADYSQPEFVDNAVSSTPKERTDCKETDDLSEQDNSISATFPNNDSNIKINFSMKPKRKRVRCRKRKSKSGERNTVSLMNLNSVNPQILPCIASSLKYLPSPQRKHIRFGEEEESEAKEMEDSNQQHTLLSKDMCPETSISEKISGTNKVPQAVVMERANLETTQVEVSNSHENFTSETTRNPVHNFSDTKYSICPSSTPLLAVPGSHPNWVTTCSDINSNSPEALQKLLSLGQQNSSPVVFERKRQTDSCSRELEPSSPFTKDSKNPASDKDDMVNGITEKNSSLVEYHGRVSSNINPLNYPLLEGKPRTKDIIAFKLVKEIFKLQKEGST